MHYRALAFSNNGLVTITPLSPFVKQDDIGQRYGFSSGDIRRINEAFKVFCFCSQIKNAYY